MIRHSLSINGRKIIEFAQPDGQASAWYPAPDERLIMRKDAHVTATGVASIVYHEIDDDTCAIASVIWEAESPQTAAQIIDSYARELAERHPA